MSLYYNSNNEEYIEIKNDEFAPSPRLFEDEINSTFITFTRNERSPDENPFENFEEMLKKFGTKFTDHMRNDLDNLMKNALKKGYVILPVWKYDHGAVVYKAAEHYPFATGGYKSETPGFEGGWDGGLCGVIYEKRDRRNIEELQHKLQDEVESYSMWVNGAVLEVIIYDKTGEYIDNYMGCYATEQEVIKDIIGYENCDLISDYYYNVEEEIANHQEKIKQKPSLEEQLSECAPDRVQNNTEKIKEKIL